MRKYEFTTVLPPEPEAVQEAKDFLQELFERHSVTIIKQEDLGIRELAYPIKKFNRGTYIYHEIELDPLEVSKIEEKLRLSILILKYLFVRKD